MVSNIILLIWMIYFINLWLGSWQLEPYHITMQKSYVAYSEDLLVTYSIPANQLLPNAFIVVLILEPEVQELATLSMPIDLADHTIRVGCGTINKRGLHALRMYMYSGGPILAEEKFHVKWPSFNISLPTSHVAYSSPVPLSVKSSIKCSPQLGDRLPFYINITHLNGETNSTNNVATFIALNAIYNAAGRSMNMEISCGVFRESGMFRAQVFHESHVFARSNIMTVKRAKAYSISSSRKNLLPCSNPIVLFINRPMCFDGNHKIRVYAIVVAERISSRNLKLSREFSVYRNTTVHSVNCDVFAHETVGYCFVYIVETLDRSVVEKSTFCLPSHSNTDLHVNGGWSQWSDWSACSHTCGTGQQNRKRLCNDPTPLFSGQYCTGSSTHWRQCHSRCPDLPSLYARFLLAEDQTCKCGCEMRAANGRFLITDHCPGLSVWSVIITPGHVIKLRFIYYKLNIKDQWLKVRDGLTYSSNLLLFYNGDPDTVLGDIFSTRNEMLIEFSSRVADNALRSKPHGINAVIVSYAASEYQQSSLSMNAVLSTVPNSHKPAWTNIVTVIAVIFSIFAFLTAVAFIVYRRLLHRLKSNKKDIEYTDIHPQLCAKDSLEGNLNILGNGDTTLNKHNDRRYYVPISQTQNVYTNLKLPNCSYSPLDSQDVLEPGQVPANDECFLTENKHSKTRTKGRKNAGYIRTIPDRVMVGTSTSESVKNSGVSTVNTTDAVVNMNPGRSHGMRHQNDRKQCFSPTEERNGLKSKPNRTAKKRISFEDEHNSKRNKHSSHSRRHSSHKRSNILEGDGVYIAKSHSQKQNSSHTKFTGSLSAKSGNIQLMPLFDRHVNYESPKTILMSWLIRPTDVEVPKSPKLSNRNSCLPQPDGRSPETFANEVHLTSDQHIVQVTETSNAIGHLHDSVAQVRPISIDINEGLMYDNFIPKLTSSYLNYTNSIISH